MYAELRTASNLRFRLEAELTSTKNRLARWFSIYFAEYSKVYGKKDAVSGMMILKAARLEFRILEEEYEHKSEQLQEVMDLISSLVEKIPEAKKLQEIKGVDEKTVSGFLTEVGDLRRFKDPGQLQKYAGLAIVENSSGKHKGQTTISKRGRKRLRYLLFEASMSLVAQNQEFKEIHKYYTTREKNPLKKMQSLTAIGCKLMRLFYTLFTKDVSYDAEKTRMDIRRAPEYQIAA